jgi:hypothetical protein
MTPPPIEDVEQLATKTLMRRAQETLNDRERGMRAVPHLCSRSLLPDGTPKGTKTEAGTRAVPMLPALRQLLAAWKLKSGTTQDHDPVIATIEGATLQERTRMAR